MDAINRKIDKLVYEYEVKESKKLIEILELSLKMARLELNILELSKPNCFQFKKIKLYQEEKEKLEKKIKECKDKINLESINLGKLLDNKKKALRLKSFNFIKIYS